jgi:hypothetical protein
MDYLACGVFTAVVTDDDLQVWIVLYQQAAYARGDIGLLVLGGDEDAYLPRLARRAWIIGGKLKAVATLYLKLDVSQYPDKRDKPSQG